jgi:AraC-like DNA-binding protein
MGRDLARALEHARAGARQSRARPRHLWDPELVREAHSVEDFVAAPIGACVIERAFGFFYPDQRLSGYMVWERATRADFDQLAKILPVVHGRDTRPHCHLVDLREMTSIDPDAFQLAMRYVVDHRVALRRAIKQLALVRAGGVTGALTAGFFSLVKPFGPVRVFTDPHEALAWLGLASYADRLDDVGRRFAAAREAAPLLRGLHAFLDDHPGSTFDEAVRHLAVSRRTLQRRLGELGTTVLAELAHARIRAARKLLFESQASVTEIAFEVGFKSTQHFSRSFRKLTGLTPSAWRQQQRRR